MVTCKTVNWPDVRGEIGERIRAFDWNETPLGALDTWSERLRGKIDLLLLHHSPMVALIGPDLIQIYNEPYRHLMGSRHPAGLGQPTRDCWPEVWHINLPIYERVLRGEALAFDDKPFPIVRDGTTQDAWFSIAYSPLIIGGDGIDGVLVTAVETSAKVRAENVRLETERRLTKVRDLAGLTSDFQALFEGAPTPLLVIAPDTFTIVAANQAYREVTLTAREEILGKPLFGVFPDDPEDANSTSVSDLRASIEQVLATGAPHTMTVQRYPVRRAEERGGGFEERWWDCVNSPLRGRDGSIALIIHGASDVTASYLAQRALRESDERQAFLLKLSDALRPLSGPIEVQEVATRILGEHLGVSRAMLGILELDQDVIEYRQSYVAEGEAPILGSFRTSDFASGSADEYRKGVPIRIDDAATSSNLSDIERANFAALNIASCLSVPLVKDGRLIAAITVARRVPRPWSDADVAAVQATVERTWEAVQRALADAGRRESEEEYRQLFTSMAQGFCVLEKVATAPGEPSDYRFSTANPAYERHTGLRDVVGRTVLEVLPGYETSTMDAYDDVVATGQHRHLESFISDLNSWFEIEALPGRLPGQVAILFSDVTARKTAEIALRDSDERQGFLLNLSDALRELADPAAIQGVACRLLGEHLGTDRAYYLEIDGESDHAVVQQDYVRDDLLPSLVGKWSLETFGYILPLYRPGLPVLIPDVLTFDRMPEAAKQETVAAGIRSYLSVPLIKESELVGALIIADDRPREWTQAEARLVDEVAQRVWASVERGRTQTSLRLSEQRYRSLFEAMDQGFYLAEAMFDEDDRCIDILYLEENPAAIRIIGQSLKGRRLSEVGDTDDFWNDYFGTSARTGQSDRVERQWGVYGRWYDVHVFKPPFAGPNGFCLVFTDITDRKHAEEELRDGEARYRALIEGVPQLVWRSRSGGHWTWTSPQWTEYTGLSEADSRGRGFMQAVHPDDRLLALDAWSRTDMEGVLAVDLRLYHAPEERHRWAALRARPLRDDKGAIAEWLGTATDIDDLRRMQDAQQVMVAELQHRTRNLIAIVSSIALQTMRGTSSNEDFQDHFNDRLAALSRVQGLLSRSEQEPITIRGIIKMELDALGALSFGDRIQLRGPNVFLRNAVVQTLSLALHELATNARKYGALATDRGELRVDWRVDSDCNGVKTLAIDWVENGLDPGREIKDPQSSGYGRELIERALPYTLHAKTRFELGDDNVCCSIELPLNPANGQAAVR